jgi:hypothetical protein
MPWLLPPPARFASAVKGATNKAAVKTPAINPRCRTSINFSYLKIKYSPAFMQAFPLNFNTKSVLFRESAGELA